jgi:PAS domain S-box-containing protein
MINPPYIQSMFDYFRRSDQFYYFLIDPKGDFIYVNPLFQKTFSHIIGDFYGMPAARIFIIDDKEKYQQAVQSCIENPLTIVCAELQIRLQEGSLAAILWEFSAYAREGNSEYIQAIGIAINEIKEETTGNQIAKKHLPQNDEQEIQKQKQLIHAAINGYEKEKQEIGKELHDNINQRLITTRLYMEIARDKLTGESFQIIDLAHKSLTNIIKEIQQLSQVLVPLSLCDIGLIESVKDICDSLQRTHALSINFSYHNFKENQLSGNLKLMLFRIIQEQINNILRHANADTLQIRLQSDAENTILLIDDNGKGFDPSNFKRGFGFTNITTRASLFNGQVKIDAAPGKGCSLSIAIPSMVIEREDMN